MCYAFDVGSSDSNGKFSVLKEAGVVSGLFSFFCAEGSPDPFE